MRVRGVLHQGDAPLVAERPHLIDLGRDQPADVDGHDGRRAGVRAAAVVAALSANVPASTSANTGLAPACSTAAAVA